MRRLLCGVLVACLAFVCLTPTRSFASAPSTAPTPQPAIKLIKTGEFPQTGDYVVGYQFTVLSPVTITDVGLFDGQGDGVLKGMGAIEIGLWDSSRRMVLSADLPLKTKLQDGVFYTPIKPLTLDAGEYVIAFASPEEGERYWFGAKIETAPQIKWDKALYVNGKQLTLPTNNAPGEGYFGPAFRIVPADSNYVSPTSSRLLIDQPEDRAIFQRDKTNHAIVPILCTAPNATDNVEARAINLKTNEPATPWTSFKATDALHAFSGQLSLPTGWYRVEIRSAKGTTPVATASIDHVGVGEVFLTCGQSNSCNHGRPRQSPSDDRVNAMDWQSGRWRHADDPQPGAEGDGGSPWPILGDILARTYNAPIGFISVGVGATSVEQWLPGGDLYRRIKIALGRVGPHGVRAILWHQGENDSVAGTSANEYYHALALIIARSRHDAGWMVPWGVALVSYHPSAPAANYPPIIAGQKRVIQTEPDVFTGPATDDYHNHDWMADGVHFNTKGLTEHAKGWAEALKPLLRSTTTAHPSDTAHP